MTRLRVMTFNVANAINTEDDGDNAWERRALLNVATIKRYAPDMIGFQQCDEGNLASYRADLSSYRFELGPAADGPDVYDYNAIAYAADRLELTDAGGFFLSETPQTWSLGWDAAYVKALTWARFRVLPDGGEFLYLNTHLDHIGERARVESVRLLLRRLPDLRGADLPVILTGDFNCNPWSPGYRIHVETTFTDVILFQPWTVSFPDRARPPLEQRRGADASGLPLQRETACGLGLFQFVDAQLGSPMYVSCHAPILQGPS